jgi:hypothetical protein
VPLMIFFGSDINCSSYVAFNDFVLIDLTLFWRYFHKQLAICDPDIGRQGFRTCINDLDTLDVNGPTICKKSAKKLTYD